MVAAVFRKVEPDLVEDSDFESEFTVHDDSTKFVRVSREWLDRLLFEAGYTRVVE